MNKEDIELEHKIEESVKDIRLKMGQKFINVRTHLQQSPEQFAQNIGMRPEHYKDCEAGKYLMPTLNLSKLTATYQQFFEYFHPFVKAEEFRKYI